ncbi:MAG: glycoside hydrolase family 2 TIM barrel-domain containing protein [Myxococcota bacterium]
MPKSDADAMPAPAVPVRVVRAGDNWRLERGGQPYVLRGVGYKAELDALVASGGNAIRTWGIGDDTRALLDEAWAKGVSVTLGLWLGHTEHGFDYSDKAAVARQHALIRQQVERFKDHPALLMWGVGNEVELEGGDDPNIWRAIEDVARMIHEVDPHHPTMVVTAEIGETFHERLKTLCPSIDIWGINSYGGAPSLPRRLSMSDWSGPIVLTEFGGHGDWERPKLPWGATKEQTSTEKAAAYRQSFQAVSNDPRTVGTFAFLWGPSERPTDTWFGLFGPKGIRYEATDVLAELWDKPVPDRAPSIVAWRAEDTAASKPLDGAIVGPGVPLVATLVAKDPEGQPVTHDWILHHDTITSAGAGPAVQCKTASGPRFETRAPAMPGPYRLLAVSRDPAGGAAFASARFHVGQPTAKSPSIALPLWVDGAFAPSGWMGDASAGGVKMNDCPARSDYCAGPCRKFEVRRGTQGWSGVVWHHPEGNWKGDRPGIRIPASARFVTFKAWGARGQERVNFAVGNQEVDGLEMSRSIVLTSTPTSYRLDISGYTWSDIAYGFLWTAAPEADEVLQFYVADITWTAGP